MEWISVKDRLPDNEKNVIICDKYGYIWYNVMYTHYKDALPRFFDDSTDTIISLKNVTHWMPLPLPPGGDQL